MQNSIAKTTNSVSPELRKAIEILKKPESYKKENRQESMATMAEGIALAEVSEIPADNDDVFKKIIDTRNRVWKVFLCDLSDEKTVRSAGTKLCDHMRDLIRTLASFQSPSSLEEAVSIVWRYTQLDLPNTRSVDIDGSKAALTRLGRGLLELEKEKGNFTIEQWSSWERMIDVCCRMDISEWKMWRDMENRRIKDTSKHHKPSALETGMQIIIDEWKKRKPQVMTDGNQGELTLS